MMCFGVIILSSGLATERGGFLTLTVMNGSASVKFVKNVILRGGFFSLGLGARQR